MKFHTWLDTYLSEKNIDDDEILEAEGSFGMNYIPVKSLTDRIKSAPEHEQKQIKNMLVKIDFTNGDVRHFLKHLAKAIAI